jgi:AraC-like DNA-binding protein
VSVLIRSDHLPPAARFEFWREFAAQRTAPQELDTDDRANYWAEFWSSDLGAIEVSLSSGKSRTLRRTPAMIRQSNPDVLRLMLFLRGEGIVTQDDREALLAPTDLALHDPTRPSAGRLGNDVQTLMLRFPRALLPLPPTAIEQLRAVCLSGSRGVGALASQFLVQLAKHADEYDVHDAARLSTAALDVLAAALAHELDCSSSLPPETHQRALLHRIHAFIQQRLGDPELSPGVIAAAHHISLRYLHKLFQEEGATVAGWIRARRLDRCRHDLTDPMQRERPVHAIAARWGFTGAAHFSTVFRATYGMAPREYRERAQQHPDGVHGSESAVH